MGIEDNADMVAHLYSYKRLTQRHTPGDDGGKALKQMGLFSTTHHHHKTETVGYAKNITINENRAHTDESVRLLSEMETSAKKKIIRSVAIEDNVINAVAIFFHDDVILDRMNYQIRFTLNSKPFLIEGNIKRQDWNEKQSKAFLGLGNEGVKIHLLETYAKILAAELIKQTP